MKARPHSDIIIAWAGGAEVQYRRDASHRWTDCPEPYWAPDYEYRVKPEREYPGDLLPTDALCSIFDSVLQVPDSEWTIKGRRALRHVANQVLRHAIDNGHVVLPGDVSLMPPPKWRESIAGFGAIDGIKEVVQAVKAVVEGREARKLAIAMAVRNECSRLAIGANPSMQIAGIDLRAIIAGVKS